MYYTMDGTSQAVDPLTSALELGEHALPFRARSVRIQSVEAASVREIGRVDQLDRGRRILNVVVAIVGLIIGAPVMAVIAILVKLTSPGPIFYTQLRVGLDRRQLRHDSGHGRRRVDYGGRLFTIYKFRTMRVEGTAKQRWASADDPRITPIGRFLRKTRLDELPQLLNVLVGDMNIVGPRPEQPAIFAELREHIDLYPHRQQVLPGITGWAQINQQYDSSIDDVKNKLRFDLEYIGRRSWTEDLRIMVRTIPVMILRKGAV